jgi:hypothetical protein
MRRLFPLPFPLGPLFGVVGLWLFVYGALGLIAYAQEATITAPVARNSVAKVKINTFACDAVAGSCTLTLRYLDSSNNLIAPSDIATLGYVTTIAVPSGANQPCTSGTTLSGLATAMNNTRATETGTAPRIQQFRILGYFSDQGCYSQAVTVAP